MNFNQNDLDDKANTWDVEYLQEQIWELQAEVRDLKEKIESMQVTSSIKGQEDRKMSKAFWEGFREGCKQMMLPIVLALIVGWGLLQSAGQVTAPPTVINPIHLTPLAKS